MQHPSSNKNNGNKTEKRGGIKNANAHNKTVNKQIHKTPPIKRSPRKYHINLSPIHEENPIDILAETLSDAELSKHLQSECIDSNDCLILGKHTAHLKNFFENMDLKFITGNAQNPIRRIGKESVNGCIIDLTFVKEDYKTHCVLKTSRKASSDNLLYEYWVGTRFINTYIAKLPCFVETYGLYYIDPVNPVNIYHKGSKTRIPVKLHDLLTNVTEYNLANISPNIISAGLKRGLLKREVFDETLSNAITESCSTPLNFSVIIQYMKNPISLDKFISDNNLFSDPIIMLELVQILIQVYLPLGKLMNEFTHNDLHWNNVLLYEIPDGKHITIIYKIDEKTKIRIKTKYFVKIIDYGRCFFKGKTHSSKSFHKVMYHNSACRGANNPGYNWFIKVNKDSHYISAYHGNVSRDLWLMGIVNHEINSYKEYNNQIFKNVKLIDLFNRMCNNNKIAIDLTHIFDSKNILNGMPIITENCKDTMYKKICNVEVMATALKILWTTHFVYINNVFSTYLFETSVGVLNVDMDKMTNMRYKPRV